MIPDPSSQSITFYTFKDDILLIYSPLKVPKAYHHGPPGLPEHGGYLHGDFVAAGGRVGHPDPTMQPKILVLQDK